jgi:hypothetical protein
LPLLLLAALWWWAPRLAPLLPASAQRRAIVVLADDPLRTEAALDLWEREPRSQFWILGGPYLLLASWDQLDRRGIAVEDPRLGTLMQGDDTVGQLTMLSERLPREVRHVTLVTDRSHSRRSLLIARLALGRRGIRVDVPPDAELPARMPPENPLRRWRDGLRVQLWRASGWDGRSLGLWLQQLVPKAGP